MNRSLLFAMFNVWSSVSWAISPGICVMLLFPRKGSYRPSINPSTKRCSLRESTVRFCNFHSSIGSLEILFLARNIFMASLDIPRMELLDMVFPLGPTRPKPKNVDAGAVCVRENAVRTDKGPGGNLARMSSNGSFFSDNTTIFPRSLTACGGTSSRFWLLHNYQHFPVRADANVPQVDVRLSSLKYPFHRRVPQKFLSMLLLFSKWQHPRVQRVFLVQRQLWAATPIPRSLLWRLQRGKRVIPALWQRRAICSRQWIDRCIKCPGRRARRVVHIYFIVAVESARILAGGRGW